MPGGLDTRDVVFNEDLAQRILLDFKECIRQTETLLVHCSRGKNRSPAVGIALNEICDLGHDTDELKRRFPEANWYVYETLLDVGKNLNL